MIFTVIGIFGIAWFLLFLWFIRCYDRGFNYLDDKWIRYFDRMKSTINRLERRIDMLEEKMEGKDEIRD